MIAEHFPGVRHTHQSSSKLQILKAMVEYCKPPSQERPHHPWQDGSVPGVRGPDGGRVWNLDWLCR